MLGYSAIMRGEFDETVFAAFKAVEVAVCEEEGYKATGIGVRLIRKATRRTALADQSLPEAEREALCPLFAGAIGTYNNPHSHRTVALTDHREEPQRMSIAFCEELARATCRCNCRPNLNWSST
jgi:Protein of unknown function (Hypoth_ymh)